MKRALTLCWADEREDKAKEEWKGKAKKELDDWYKHHAEQLEKTRENNRYCIPSLTIRLSFLTAASARITVQTVTELCERERF